MKIYTSYHKRHKEMLAAGITPVNIALYPPRWLKAFDKLKTLAPTKTILAMGADDYKIAFAKHLATLDATEIIKQLTDLGDGNDVAICCYEKEPHECHRSQVAEWIKSETGYSISEW